jgi:HAD superfamily phosphatase
MRAVLFDMDGVLVDVSKSYREAIKQTVLKFSNREISFDEIQQYKNIGGLNNDWDLTEYILRDRSVKANKNTIIEVFQEFYIGRNYNGFIQNDKWQLSVDTLTYIRNRYKTGIVTGRPEREALYTLKRFGMEQKFSVVITMDHLPPDRGKPDPLGIQMAMKGLGACSGWYIGDTVDDIIAANRAGVIPIGVLAPPQPVDPVAQLMLDNGARQILKNVNELRRFLHETTSNS